jgi:hypothetical protein
MILATDLSFSLSCLTHMRKYFFPLLLSVLSFPAIAQKKFFSEGTALAHLYFDDYYIDKDYWLSTFAKGNKPASLAFDSLSDGTSGATPYSIKGGGGGGIQFRLLRDLSVFREGSRSKMFWNVGAGFRIFRMSSEGFSFFPFFMQRDTTKIYYIENEQFQLRQTFVDIYNAVRYELHGKLLRRMYAYAGLGTELSLAIDSKISDEYYRTDEQWNTSGRRWETINIVDTVIRAKAKKLHTYGWTIPFGIGFIVSDRAKLEFGMEYFHRKRTPDPYPERKYSEGAMFQMLIRFNL